MPPNSVKLVSREVPLPVVRVASMFVSAKDKAADLPDGESGGFIEKVQKKRFFLSIFGCFLEFNLASNLANI